MRSTLYAALLSVIHFGPAAAHAVLLDSQPALNGVVPEGEARIVLRFNSRIDPARSRLVLTRPDRTEVWLPIAPGTPADVLTATAPLTLGEHSVRWQVLAVDGHITRGEVPFTVRARAARAK